eukprot:Nk52_evm16s218 gene=Nk52_evmTU16s218
MLHQEQGNDSQANKVRMHSSRAHRRSASSSGMRQTSTHLEMGEDEAQRLFARGGRRASGDDASSLYGVGGGGNKKTNIPSKGPFMAEVLKYIRHINFNNVLALLLLLALALIFLNMSNSGKRRQTMADGRDVLVPYGELKPFPKMTYSKDADYLPSNVLTIFSILRQLHPSSTDKNHVSEKYNEGLGYISTVNAVRSWLSLGKPVSVVLFGDQTSCNHVVSSVLVTIPSDRRKYVRCVDIPCFDAKYGAPMYSCIFAKAKELALGKTEFIMYSNSDIIYTDDLLHTINRVSIQFSEKLLMIGSRQDFDFWHYLDVMKSNWQESIRNIALNMGVEHNYFGIDYFLFRTKFFPEMPDFLVGRIRWDNWLVATRIKTKGFATVDSSNAVLALHQNHVHSYASHNRPGREVNEKIMGSVDYNLGHIQRTYYVIERVWKKDEAIGRFGHHRNILDCSEENPSVFEHCKIERRPQDLSVMLWKHAVKKNVVVLSNSCTDENVVNEWVASVKKAKISNYFIQCYNEHAFRELLLNTNLPVMYISPQEIIKGRRIAPYPNPTPAGEMILRLFLIKEIVKRTHFVLSVTADVVVNGALILELGEVSHDLGMVGANKEKTTLANASFSTNVLYVKPSTETLSLFEMAFKDIEELYAGEHPFANNAKEDPENTIHNAPNRPANEESVSKKLEEKFKGHKTEKPISVVLLDKSSVSNPLKEVVMPFDKSGGEEQEKK